MLGSVHSLRYIWYTRRFGKWLYSRVQVFDCLYTNTFLLLFILITNLMTANHLTDLLLLLCLCISIKNTNHLNTGMETSTERSVYQICFRQWTVVKKTSVQWVEHCHRPFENHQIFINIILCFQFRGLAVVVAYYIYVLVILFLVILVAISNRPTLFIRMLFNDDVSIAWFCRVE
jgi:hypothetical protein